MRIQDNLSGLGVHQVLAQLGQDNTLSPEADQTSEGGGTEIETSKFMQAQFAHYIVFGSAILALLYALYCFITIHRV